MEISLKINWFIFQILSASQDLLLLRKSDQTHPFHQVIKAEKFPC